jgi:3-hydroxyacyl-[acyl-carrier-protein] dehydratase
MPASLIIEALGQLGVLFLLKSDHPDLEGETRQDSIYFTSCDGIRCQKVCRPGDTLTLKIKPKKIRHPLAFFEGSVAVKGEKVAFAESITLTFDISKNDSQNSPHINGVNSASNGEAPSETNRVVSHH